MDLKKIDKLLVDMDTGGATTTTDVAKNTAKGHVPVIGGEKKKKKKKKKNESSVVGGSYVDGTTVNIIGSGQTRVGAVIKREIEVLDRKDRLKGILGFDKKSGAYIPSQWGSDVEGKESEDEEQ